MGFPAISLTAVGGGINRLRTKGSASKDSLFDLLNGYVTQGGTVKVREGTYRNANIATYSGAGATKGLLAYQGKLHVFANTVVSVPPGYALHVLNHPAYNQVSTVTGSQALTQTVAFNSSAGLNTETVDGGFTLNPPCANSVGSITVAGFGDGTQIVGLYTHAHATYDVVLVLSGTLSQNYFTDLKFTPSGGVLTTLVSTASSSFDTASKPGYSIWRWTNAVTNPMGGAAGAVTFDGVPLSQTTGTVPIAEIHFAAPYLGGIYVAASFTVVDPAVLAQYGDTFHYWIQSSSGGDNSNVWVASQDYNIGDVVIPSTVNGLTYVASRRNPPNPVWSPSTVEAVNNVVEPTTANGFQYTVSSVLGTNPTTGTVEPTWPTTDGAIVKENSAVASDQTVTRVTAADPAPTPTPPPRYSGGIAGGFKLS